MGQNGTLTSVLDGSYPGQQMGEAVAEGDFIGQRAAADSNSVTRTRWLKAFAGVTGGGNTQLEARAVAGMDMTADAYDAVRPNKWRMALPATLPAALSGLLPGEPVYLSTATPGAIQRTKPSVTGQLVQIVGYAYWWGERDTGINAAETANSILVSIQPATVV